MWPIWPSDKHARRRHSTFNYVRSENNNIKLCTQPGNEAVAVCVGGGELNSVHRLTHTTRIFLNVGVKQKIVGMPTQAAQDFHCSWMWWGDVWGATLLPCGSMVKYGKCSAWHCSCYWAISDRCCLTWHVPLKWECNASVNRITCHGCNHSPFKCTLRGYCDRAGRPFARTTSISRGQLWSMRPMDILFLTVSLVELVSVGRGGELWGLASSRITKLSMRSSLEVNLDLRSTKMFIKVLTDCSLSASSPDTPVSGGGKSGGGWDFLLLVCFPFSLVSGGMQTSLFYLWAP